MTGNAPLAVKGYVTQYAAPALNGEVTAFKCELQDGRTISISHKRLSDGGFVASHDDISEAVEAQAALARAKEEAERARTEAEQANEAKIRVSRHHEPRDPHAAQRHPRL